MSYVCFCPLCSSACRLPPSLVQLTGLTSLTILMAEFAYEPDSDLYVFDASPLALCPRLSSLLLELHGAKCSQHDLRGLAQLQVRPEWMHACFDVWHSWCRCSYVVTLSCSCWPHVCLYQTLKLWLLALACLYNETNLHGAECSQHDLRGLAQLQVTAVPARCMHMGFEHCLSGCAYVTCAVVHVMPQAQMFCARRAA
jgi:hypothetical protein